MSKLLQISILAVFACALASFSTSCSSGDNSGASDPGSGPSATATSSGDAASDAAAAVDTVTNTGGAPTATIKGSVVFKGDAPERTNLDMSGNKECAAIHAGGNTPLTETIIVGENGALANAFVYITKGLEGQKFPVPTEKVLFDQKGCKYTPHVFGIRVGQELEVRNSDSTLHNVHMFPDRSNHVNRSQSTQGNTFVQKFRRAEAKPMRIKCDVHPWMTAYAGVLDHPYFVVTGDDGTFELPKIAPGTYTVTVWHEYLVAVAAEQQVTVADGETKELAAIELEEE